MRIANGILAVGLLLTQAAIGLSQNVEPGKSAPSAVPDMGYVPAGDFWMGRVRLWLIDEIGWQMRERADDRPLHLVHVDAFYIDTHEVTNAQYAEFVKATGAAPPYQWRGTTPPADRATIPIYNVSWSEAAAYCEWKGKRLPTEAEWEKAARGGLDRQDFPWGMEYETEVPAARNTSVNAKPSTTASADGTTVSAAPVPARSAEPEMRANAWSNSAIGPTTVGKFQPNGYGLYDMSGNVWEWTSDWYDLYAYSVSERRNPKGPKTGLYKVIRGGSWLESESRLLAVYQRNFANPDLRAPTVGFRCAKSSPQ